MERLEKIQPQHVEYVPSELKHGVLYVSQKYRTAVHLCCCGCGSKVVTPLKPYAWRITERRGTASLFPSIGNWSFACRSHYWITNSRVEWAGEMTRDEIKQVRVGDQVAREKHFYSARNRLWQRFIRWLKS